MLTPMTNSRAVANKTQDFSLSNKCNISWLFLISSRQDWLYRLLKSWILDFSLHKIIAIDVPLVIQVY